MRRFTKLALERIRPIPIMTAEEVDEYVGDPPIMDDNHPYLEYPLFRNTDSPEIMGLKSLAEFRASRRR